MGLMIRANLGLDPWDAFHQGIATHVPWSFGVVTIVVGAAVLLLWIPLRQRPGLGTLSNVVVVGVAVDAALWALPTMTWLPGRWTFLIAGIVLNGIAGGCYIGAGLGPGPRDGLMTGLVAKTGGSVRVIRTGIELGVLAIGWLLGGTVGIGTILYAISIGPVVHVTLPLLTVPSGTTSTTQGSADDGGLAAAA
ncbi:YitT family protein [Cryptosporangium sp. NPDC048952]|uniref:membrane protein YczE n=1 Tax=Cryptosporangium sp. NPDC048952 TaxID=3363961 RepID=UPI00371AE961